MLPGRSNFVKPMSAGHLYNDHIFQIGREVILIL